MAAMPADVEEPSQRSGVIACQEDRLPTYPNCAPAVGTHQAFGSSQADPRWLEEVAHLPGKELKRCVCLSRKRVALPELGERTWRRVRSIGAGLVFMSWTPWPSRRSASISCR